MSIKLGAEGMDSKCSVCGESCDTGCPYCMLAKNKAIFRCHQECTTHEDYYTHIKSHRLKDPAVKARLTVDADKRKNTSSTGNLPKRPTRKTDWEMVVPGEVMTADDLEIADLLDMQNSDSSSMQRYLRELDPSNAGSEEEEEVSDEPRLEPIMQQPTIAQSSSSSSVSSSSDDSDSESSGGSSVDDSSSDDSDSDSSMESSSEDDSSDEESSEDSSSE